MKASLIVTEHHVFSITLTPGPSIQGLAAEQGCLVGGAGQRAQRDREGMPGLHSSRGVW